MRKIPLFWKFVIVGLPVAFMALNFWLTGFPFPIVHLESLDKPVQVNGWTADALQLADGRLIRLPGVARLTQQSKFLKEATSRGIEIDRQGRVIGLVRNWHWCGNDPVRFDLRRVDLAHGVSFFERTPMDKQRSSSETGLPRSPGPMVEGGLIGGNGWNMTEFGMFKRYEKELLADKLNERSR